MRSLERCVYSIGTGRPEPATTPACPSECDSPAFPIAVENPLAASFRSSISIMPKYVVRYGAMRFLGVFSTRGNDRWDRTARVIARTNRGLEVGEILCEATDAAVQQLCRSPITVRSFAK